MTQLRAQLIGGNYLKGELVLLANEKSFCKSKSVTAGSFPTADPSVTSDEIEILYGSMATTGECSFRFLRKTVTGEESCLTTAELPANESLAMTENA